MGKSPARRRPARPAADPCPGPGPGPGASSDPVAARADLGPGPREGGAPTPDRVEVAPGVVLDGRLALFHRDEGWLAVADVHYGYELSLRRGGALVPRWGMEEVEARLAGLIRDWRPRQLVVVGDLVHDAAGWEPVAACLARLRALLAAAASAAPAGAGAGAGSPAAPGTAGAPVVLVTGNHDRRGRRKSPAAAAAGEWCDAHLTPGFCFVHGDRPVPPEFATARTVVSGHFHPAFTLRDGAGLRMKVPAFVQRSDGGWVLPAFSPWAAGDGAAAAAWQTGPGARVWLCGKRRVFPLPPGAGADPVPPPGGRPGT